MIFFFWIRESFKIIGRSKLFFILSLISTSISVILIIASIVSFQVSNELKAKITRSMTVNIFLKDSLTSEQINNLNVILSEKISIQKVTYIDKQTAAELFIKQTGEDFRKILDYNPLPASYTLSIAEDFLANDSLKQLIGELKQIPEVDEVVYQQEFISEIIRFMDSFKKYLLIVTTILIIISLYVVYSTVKLIINSKYSELETMKLVGAKLSTIKLPIIFNGLITGLFAGLVAIIFFYFISKYVGGIFGAEKYFNVNNMMYLVIALCAGPLLNLLVSIIALRKISLKI